MLEISKSLDRIIDGRCSTEEARRPLRSGVGTRPPRPSFRSLLLNFLPPFGISSSSSSLLLWFSALALLLAWAGCNRFPEARAHYRPVGLAITCEASFDFVCASQHSFRLSASPSEILRGSSAAAEKEGEAEGERGPTEREGRRETGRVYVCPEK